MTVAAPRVFTIPPGAPFLPTLADAILDGTLVPGIDYRADPVALADLTLFLPTRRAARAFSAALVERLGGGAAVLPRIRPLGDVDEDGVDGLADPAEIDLSPAVGEHDRLVALAGLVREWRKRVSPDALLLPSGHAISVPASTADAVTLARGLVELIDQAAIEGVDWTRITKLVPDDYAGWWQLTLGFLRVATEHWPEHLAETGRMDPAARRLAVMRALTGRLRAGAVDRPVIAAGSTGSQPATAALLAAVSRLPRGSVVLPGLDVHLDEATFQSLAEGREEGTISHPQGSMARLLVTIGVARRDVAPIGRVDAAADARARIMSTALLPCGRTDRWPAFSAGLADDPQGTAAALDGIAVLTAANEAEEALAVAVALREALETPGATAALVTPDRGLARRVSAELARFGILAEDSAGVPLAGTPPGVLAHLVAECAAGGLDPVSLVALTRHPLATFGLSAAKARAAARVLEIACLRGPRLAAGTAALVEAVAALAGRTGRVHPAVKRLGPGELAAAGDLARRIHQALAPLEAMRDAGAIDHRMLLQAHLDALRAVAADETGGDGGLFDGAAGTGLARFFAGHLDTTAPALPVGLAELPTFLRALMQTETARLARPLARVSVWGQIEARMMSVDRLVVGGLNEGVWPTVTDTGPWLSRPMRTRLGFPPPEQRVGLSAHDFAQSLGSRDVVLTRAAKRGGAPTVPSRFLTRLLGLVGETGSAMLVARGDRFTDWARRLDDRAPEDRARQPEPKPPVKVRPRELSVTEIETWIRDPYAIYARRILRLEPLPELGERPHFGTRGSVVHDALARFAREWDGPFDATAADRLVEIGQECFVELERFPEIHALWWPRFVAAARWLIPTFEAGRADASRYPEATGKWQVTEGPDGFLLKGRADRIDVLSDGSLSIVDFKTGTAPSDRQIALAKAPQLALEAAIARRGGFDLVPAGEASELVHVLLKGIENQDKVCCFTGMKERKDEPGKTVAETISDTERALEGLVAAYADPAKGYLSRAHPFKANSRGVYDHLARVAEWSVGGDDEGGET